MSSSTARPDPPHAAHRAAAVLRVVLVLGYLALAHLAGTRNDPRLAALAVGDIAVIVLLGPLLARRAWAWGALALASMALLRLAHSAHALAPLLLVPVAILCLVGWSFARTLRGGRVPLITRIVAALDGTPAAQLAPELQHYARTLTRLWASLLGVLALVNLALAALAVPDGLLASAGLAPPLTITETQWSWCANLGNYGLVGGFMLLEFAYRQRRFPGRYHSLFDFLRRLARLEPTFWTGLFR